VTASLLAVDRVTNLVEEGLDIGVRIGQLPSSELVAVKVGQVRNMICGSPDYFEKYGIPQTPKDLVNHKIVSSPVMSSQTIWRFGKSGDRTVKVPPRLSFLDFARDRLRQSSGLGLSASEGNGELG